MVDSVKKETIKCTHCGKPVEIGEALRKQFEEKEFADLRQKQKAKIDEMEREHQGLLEAERAKKQKEIDAITQNHQKTLDTARAQNQEQIEKMREQITKDQEERIKNQYVIQVESLTKANEEGSKQIKELNEKVLGLLEDQRKFQREQASKELEMRQQIAEAEQKARSEALQKSNQTHELEKAEKDKQLQDAKKQINDLKEQLERGSSQTRGEAMELLLEDELKKYFPQDDIEEVSKGKSGADIKQTVLDRTGRDCGMILWELKNTTTWNKAWVNKLVQDKREANANHAVLVTKTPPKEMDEFPCIRLEEVLVVKNIKDAIAVAMILRREVIALYKERASQSVQDDKQARVYQYLTSIEFKNRVEEIVGAYKNTRDEIEKEKRFFHAKWARQEKEMDRVIKGTWGMYGDLQEITQRGLPEIKALELPDMSEDEEGNDDN